MYEISRGVSLRHASMRCASAHCVLVCADVFVQTPVAIPNDPVEDAELERVMTLAFQERAARLEKKRLQEERGQAAMRQQQPEQQRRT